MSAICAFRPAGIDVKRTLRIAVVDVVLVAASAEGAHAKV
jgi:hypothetical protein